MQNSKEMKPEEVWACEEKSKEWLKVMSHSQPNDLSREYLVEKFKDVKDSFSSIMEVGAGNGRMIKKLKDTFPNKIYYSLDINKYLSEYVAQNVGITTFVGDVYNIPLGDNFVDFIFTYQVLQHVPQDRIKKAISELKRIAKKEIWLIEGFVEHYYRRDEGYKRGIKTHNIDGGSFAYYYDDMDIGVYDNEVCRYGHWWEGKIKLYKIKV